MFVASKAPQNIVLRICVIGCSIPFDGRCIWYVFDYRVFYFTDLANEYMAAIWHHNARTFPNETLHENFRIMDEQTEMDSPERVKFFFSKIIRSFVFEFKYAKNIQDKFSAFLKTKIRLPANFYCSN